MPKIRVLIIEDSAVIRQFLEHIISSDPRLEVAAAVESAEEALRILHRVSPDVISMDIRLPGMNGFEATRQIMADKPTPIIVVSASVEANDLKISMNALRAGALAVVEKPVGTSHQDYEAMAARLCTQLTIMSQVKVIRQRIQRPISVGDDRKTEWTRPKPRTPATGGYAALGLVASTGGPNALVKVLNDIGPDFPLPVFLVQHITASFLNGFVSWLDDVCPQPVQKAKHGETQKPGIIYVAPEDRHLCFSGSVIKMEASPPVCSQRPSGTVLFKSMAASLGHRAIGVLLTGMGDDGAEGLGDIREAGGYTIAEDESSAVVYGMPAAAVKLGAVCESLPLGDIAARIRELVK